jgi:hypothetical protein
MKPGVTLGKYGGYVKKYALFFADLELNPVRLNYREQR